MAQDQRVPKMPLSAAPELGEAVRQLVERLFRRGRKEVGKAARVSRSRLELRQAQRDLDHFWVRLGKTAYHLTEAKEIDHPALRKAMIRIDELEARLAAIKAGEAAPAPTESES